MLSPSLMVTTAHHRPLWTLFQNLIHNNKRQLILRIVPPVNLYLPPQPFSLCLLNLLTYWLLAIFCSSPTRRNDETQLRLPLGSGKAASIAEDPGGHVRSATAMTMQAEHAYDRELTSRPVCVRSVVCHPKYPKMSN
ncbi:hypothetical protein AOQ84DRAFT_30659 [Glonium stellatum]|uniref:Uncharacterized protein n=1 Tax=Glonium stellatum TaxID=574774 RepID=A0A8E2F2B1_9PEZI|nr:hypothetical protein AOQ84DRAFT_30659 [Glonium stellatum]